MAARGRAGGGPGPSALKVPQRWANWEGGIQTNVGERSAASIREEAKHGEALDDDGGKEEDGDGECDARRDHLPQSALPGFDGASKALSVRGEHFYALPGHGRRARRQTRLRRGRGRRRVGVRSQGQQRT